MKKRQSLLAELWHTRIMRLFLGTLGVLLICTAGVLIALRQQEKKAPIPTAIIEVADFPPYFYKDDIPGGFTLNKGSATLTGSVLFIRLSNDKNQGVTMTQQAVPSDLLQSSLSGEKIEGAPGRAIIGTYQGRTTATLLTEDNKTMVLIDTTDQIETEIIRELVRKLRPLR